MINDLVISQIRQRLEILYQMVDELETGGGGGGGGTTNYNDLSNKPSIEGTQLVGNKSASDLGLATTTQINNKITDAFSPSTITLAEGGTFPSASRDLLTAHKPINVNDDQYYFLEESGVDYLYGSMPTSGAYPSISYLRIMKSSFTVEFHTTGIDTVPTDGSDNLITSGAVYDAVQGGGGGGGGDVDLTPRLISVSSNVISQDDFNNVIAKHLPYKTSEAGVGYYFLYERSSSYIYINYKTYAISDTKGAYAYSFVSIDKTSRQITGISAGGGHGYDSVNSRNLLDTFFDGYYLDNGAVYSFPSDLNNASSFGIYKKTSTGAVTNCPTQELAYMEYSRFLGPNQQIQKIYTIGTTPTIYIRTKTSGTWSSWYKFEGTVVS